MGIVPLFGNRYYVTFLFSCDTASVWYDVNEISIITTKTVYLNLAKTPQRQMVT